jgi:dienelactone hydrolase
MTMNDMLREDLLALASNRTTVSRREFVAGSLAVGFALAVQPVAAQTMITTDTNGLTAGEVKIPTANGDIPAYRAMPANGKNLATILVVQEIFGVHEHIKDVCRRFAKIGYLAIAPEMYFRQGDVSKLKDNKEIFAKVVNFVPDAQVMSDLDAAVAWANMNGGDGKRLGITGFCWGGRITWLYTAHNKNVKAGVAWYGRLVGQDPERHRRKNERGAEGEGQAVDDPSLSGHPACFPRRLPAELPQGAGSGRLETRDRVVQEARRLRADLPQNTTGPAGPVFLGVQPAARSSSEIPLNTSSPPITRITVSRERLRCRW